MRIVIGEGSCGLAAGAGAVHTKLSALLEQSNPTGVELGITGCIGMCFLEPIVDIYDDEGGLRRLVKVTEKDAAKIYEAVTTGNLALVDKLLIKPEDDEFLSKQTRIALRDCGVIDPESIDDYLAHDGYAAIAKILNTGMSQEDVIQQIDIAGLRGRGGAGFSTAFKWRAARDSKGDQKYLICNADEGDPGAFMDRAVIEGDPHSLIEGMLIGAYSIGASEGIVYVRAEYPLAITRLRKAIADATERGYLGKNILGSDFSFTLGIKAGAGAFVCGEETALIESLEGKRGMPRLKPPFPAQAGYWLKPSNINNVETYANVAWIINNGGAAFAAMGTQNSKGTKVFALSGKIARGGLVEVPMGTTLREVIFDIGGGIRGGKEFKAVQLGGPSGGCVPASKLDTVIDYNELAATGAIMGSGGMVVMDQDTCMVGMARFFLDFTAKESCGKCVHCRLGTKRMLEILSRIVDGKGEEGDIEKLEELCYAVKDGALCGLGQTAPNPVLTTIRYFRDEFEAHISDHHCPAGE
ncbi:MAG: NuoF family protein, partial [Coriobacteriales bacterium]|nr:NuoF family protein [Coriobacteriales bacterium]